MDILFGDDCKSTFTNLKPSPHANKFQSAFLSKKVKTLQSGGLITAETLKNKFTGKSEKPISLVKIFQFNLIIRKRHF